jgi:hypothetical protein
VFGPENFRSEIIWKRSSAHSDTKQGRKIHGHIYDTRRLAAGSPALLFEPFAFSDI